MINIRPVSMSAASNSAAAQSDSTTDSTTTTVDKTEFLKLLVAQLQHQDPMNPVDNQNFIAQLATFSSLEQLIAINQAVTQLAGGTDASTTNAANHKSNS